jgi:Trk K+ transport system NAD-binding subunit
MAEADLDVVIRQTAKAQNKSLMAALKKRRGQIMARVAKAKSKEARDQLRLMAKSTMELGAAAAKRLQNSAEITADSYARAIRHAAEEAAKTAAKHAKDGAKAKAKKAAKAG